MFAQKYSAIRIESEIFYRKMLYIIGLYTIPHFALAFFLGGGIIFQGSPPFRKFLDPPPVAPIHFKILSTQVYAPNGALTCRLAFVGYALKQHRA